MALKILVCGDVDGNFSELFGKVGAVHKKKGPFDMLLCVGNFFGNDKLAWEEYTSGKRTVPLQTYIIGQKSPLGQDLYPDTDGIELCENVTFLGKRGVLTGASGLKIAYFSGLESKDKMDKKHCFTVEDAHKFISGQIESTQFRGVDILMTSQWPKGISQYGTKLDVDDPGSESIAMLTYFLKPRYHFSAYETLYYERLPYRNHIVLAESARHATRFVSLASVGNTKKTKWLYAFTITPMLHMNAAELVKQPPDVTECPFKYSESDLLSNQSKQYFYNLNPVEGKGGKRHSEGGAKKPKKKRQEIVQDSCWFCLSSPKVEKHLVISIGECCYLALAKGGLTPDHVLILPVGHHKCTVTLDEDALFEIQRFKEVLKAFYKSRDKVPVFFERNYKSFHLQVQVIPVPNKYAPRVKDVFVDHAQSLGMDLDELPPHSDIKQIVEPDRPYFFLEFGREKLLHCIKRSFPLQFGREVLASEELLNVPDLVDWQSCTASKEEESAMVSDFRKGFMSYDFTMED